MSDRKLALTVIFKGIDGLTGVMRGITAGTGKAQAGLRKMNDELKAQKAALAMTREGLANASGNVTQLMNAESRLEAQVAATTKKIKDQRDALARQAKADAMGQNLRSRGVSNIQGGLLAAIPLALAVQQAANFQDGMIDIQQKTKMSAADTDKLKNNILAAAHAAKQLPESMRQGVDFLAGAGIQDQGVLTGLMGPIGRTATAEKASIEDLSKATFANFDNLKVPVNETALALDAMTMAGKDGNVEIRDMAQYFPGLTAQMAALGQKGVPAVADLAAGLEIAKHGAQDAAGAATNLQDLLASINSIHTEKAFAAYGVDLPKAMKKAYSEGKTPLEAIAELTKKTLGGDLSQIPHLFRNQEAASAVRQLALNMDEYRHIRTDALNSAGEVDRDFAIRAAGASANAQALLGDLQHLAIIAGDKLLPPLVALADKASDLSDKFAKWADNHRGLTTILVDGIAAMIAMKIAMGGLQFAFGSIVGPAMKAYNGLKWLYGFGQAAGFVAEGAPLLEGALIGMGTAMDAFGAGLLAAAWPIALIVAAIALLALAAWWVIKNWEPVKAFLGAFFGSLYQTFKPGIDAIVGAWTFLDGVFKKHTRLIMGLMAVFNPIMAMVQPLLAGIDWLKQQPWFADLGKWMIKSMIDGIYFMMGPLGMALHKAVDAGTASFQAKQYGLAGDSLFDHTSRKLHRAGAGHTITVHAAPGQDPEAVARAVSAELDRRDGHKEAATRSAYRDDDA